VSNDYAWLKTIPLFASLKEADLAYASSIVKQTTHPANTVIIRQSGTSGALYIIESGQVRIRRYQPDTTETVTLLLGPGQFFGETGLLYHEPRNATAEAVVNTTLLRIEQHDFDAMTSRLPAVRRQLEATANRRRGLHRFEWQRHDEVAIWIAARNIVPSIVESLGGIVLGIGIAYGMTLLSFQRLPGLEEWSSVWQGVLRIGALVMYSFTLMWHIVDWAGDYMVLTNQRVVHVKRNGFLRETRDEIPVKDIQNVMLSRRGVLAATLRLSDITVEAIETRLTFTPFGDADLLRDRILYQLLDEKAVDADDFELSRYRKAYLAVTHYPDCAEVDRLMDTLLVCLACKTLSALPTAVNSASDLMAEDSPIRRTVLTAVDRLREISAEIITYQAATSRVGQLAALARASDALDKLDKDIVAQVPVPEQAILRRIVRQWRRLVSEAGGQVGRAEEASPIINPYVVGNPVTGNLFVGRESILRRLEELWSGIGQRTSVVLYGHRRIGKSSILRNLGARFGADTVVVDFNMQRVGLVANTSELLCNLAVALYDSFHPRQKGILSEPDEKRFAADNPYTIFDRFLKQLDRARTGERFIIAVDEFELIEEMFALKVLEPRLLDFFRGLIQTYPWFVMAFAGLHTLREMTEDYWHPLFGSVTTIPVSFLGHAAAWRLITQPTRDFPLDYDADAVERIITLTHGQPYVVQLIGHGLVSRFNRQIFEEGIQRERQLTLADVEAIISVPEFYRDGDAYFTGVWVQAEKSEPPGQTAALRVLARSEAGMPVEETARDARLPLKDTQRALETLARHDVVMQEKDRWKFTVELMRRWVAQSI